MSPLKKISSSKYPLTRLLLPLLPDIRQVRVQLAVGAVVAGLVLTGLWIILIMPLMAAGLLVVIHHAPHVVHTNFCQDVWMDDAEFVLQFRKQQVRVPFDQVQSVTWHGTNNPPRAKIRLTAAGPMGSVWTFVPDLSQGRHLARKTIESINNQTTTEQTHTPENSDA